MPSLAAEVMTDPDQFPAGFAIEELERMPFPDAVLVCPPRHFDVIDVKNPFMEGQIGQVDKTRACEQWRALCLLFGELGLRVEAIEPVPGLEDMVFSANQTFSGLDANGTPICIPSRMRYRSRQREVPYYTEWFRQQGYRIADVIPEGSFFEGGGDAIWHPGRRLLWGGHGSRSDAACYEAVSEALAAPLVQLALPDPRFYHLDTCFCPLDEQTVMVFPGALTAEGMRLVRRLFLRVIEVAEADAVSRMACNAAPFGGRSVVLQEGSEFAAATLRSLGYSVHEVDTSEFLKSGGSVYCLKSYLFPAP